MGRTRRIVAIQNAEGEDLGLLSAPLAELGIETRLVRAFAGERVPERLAADEDALLVLGGPQHVYDLSTGPYMADEMRLLRHAHAARKPILGVCLGAQLLAHALGGPAVPAACYELGFSRIEPARAAGDDPLMRALASRLDAAFSAHEDSFVLPAGAVRLARSKEYEEQAFRVGASSYGLQFHVDLTPRAIDALLHRESADLARGGVDVDAIRREVAAREAAMRELARDVAREFAKLA